VNAPPPIQVVTADLARRDHARAVVDLLDAYARDPMGDGRPLYDEVRRELIPGLRRQPNAMVLLAYVGETAAAVAVCFLGFSTFRARPLLNIHDFAVRPEHQGRGIGRLLMDEVERAARAAGCCKITLEVRADNARARRLYSTCGFDPGEPGTSEMSFWTKFL
jgi:GNAT superfamily N-acetyltransferase